MSQNDLAKPRWQPCPIPLKLAHDVLQVLFECFSNGDELLDVDEEVGRFKGGDNGGFALLRKGTERDGIVL